MTFSSYPEDDVPPARPDPSTRRRALIWAGGVSAAIVALAAAGWLVFGNNGSGPEPAAGGSVVTPADSPTGTATASQTPSRAVAPGVPTGGPGTPAPGLPVSYRVATDLCPSVDFAPLSGLAGAASGGPGSGQKDYGESGYTDYSCLQKYVQGSANVQAEIFGDPAGAGAWYDSSRTNAVAPADVAGVGSAAFEYLVPGDRIETYRLWVRDGNLDFGVTVQVKGDNLPGPKTLRAAAVNVAKAAMPKLRG
jgi:hypothetical protein